MKVSWRRRYTRATSARRCRGELAPPVTPAAHDEHGDPLDEGMQEVERDRIRNQQGPCTRRVETSNTSLNGTGGFVRRGPHLHLAGITRSAATLKTLTAKAASTNGNNHRLKSHLQAIEQKTNAGSPTAHTTSYSVVHPHKYADNNRHDPQQQPAQQAPDPPHPPRTPPSAAPSTLLPRPVLRPHLKSQQPLPLGQRNIPTQPLRMTNRRPTPPTNPQTTRRHLRPRPHQRMEIHQRPRIQRPKSHHSPPQRPHHPPHPNPLHTHAQHNRHEQPRTKHNHQTNPATTHTSKAPHTTRHHTQAARPARLREPCRTR